MTNNAQPLPLPELSDDDLELLHYNPNTSDVVEFLHRYAQSYALACVEAAKPADALGSLPEPNVCYLHTPVHECDPMKLPVPQYAYSPELFRAEIAKRDAATQEWQDKWALEFQEHAKTQAKLAGVDGLVEALRKISVSSGNQGLFSGMSFGQVEEMANNAIATYEAAQEPK